MTAVAERGTAVRGASARRGWVRSLDAHQLDDGRWEIVVAVLTPSGKKGRITVRGALFVPCVAGEPWEASTLVLELVPVGPQGPASSDLHAAVGL